MSSAFDGLPKTPNLKLNKPGYDNVADIEALNENADILDAEIQGIKNTFVKSVNGINAGDDGNVDLGIIPISQGGTGQTTARGVRNALGLGNTTGALPIANGGTGATTVASARNALGLGNTSGAVPIANGGTGQTTASGVRNALGLGNTTGAVPIANGGTGATTAAQARVNLGINDVAIEATDYIIESYRNGTEWYEVYKSGKVRQGGHVYISTDSTSRLVTVNFLKPFANTDYCIYGGLRSIDSTGATTYRGVSIQCERTPDERSTTGFKMLKHQYASKFWVAEGQGA